MDQVSNAPNFAKGERIKAPGIYAGVDIDQYHEDVCDAPSISSSGIRKMFKESPADYFLGSPYNTAVKEDGTPERKPRTVNEGMLLGKAAHTLLLGEKGFASRYILRPKMVDAEPWHGNRKVCKAWLAAAEKAGKVVIKDEQIEHIKGMAASLAREPLIKNGILRGQIERSFFHKDPRTGLWLKARPDVQPNDADDFVDLKTASSVDDDTLERSIDDFGYYIQAAVVGICWQALTGRPMRTFNLVFVRSSPPYSVNMKEIKASDIKTGSEEALLTLQLFKQCLATGEWFGPAGRGGDLKPVTRKPWAVENAAYRYKVLETELKNWTAKKTETPVGLA